MRFVLAIIAVVLLCLVGLYVYGLTLKPNSHQIEQDAVRSADA